MRKATMLVAVLSVFCCLSSMPIRGQTVQAVRYNPITTHHGTQALMGMINRIVGQESGNNTNIAVFVKSMKYGDVLYTRNANQTFTPASTLKVLTAEAALLYLGPNYRFSTQLLTDGKILKDGILQGNLYIVLSGDPTLTYYDVEELLLSLKNNHINAITGDVYIDNTAYDQGFYGPGWDSKDKKNCYAAPISASIINRNCLAFKVIPSVVSGQMAQVITSSNYFYPLIKNSVVTKAKTRCSMHLTAASHSMITIDGCLSRGSAGAGVSYVVTDVPEYNRALFKTLLRRLGVRVYGSVTFGSTTEKLAVIGVHNSLQLRYLVLEMLKKSDNIIAGALFKKIGQLYSRKPGSWENGSAAVADILAKRAHVNTAGLRILDGSGLSPDNLTTPAQMMQVLDFAYHHTGTSNEFISSLPISGVDGTLKNRMGNIARKVRAKTGTISGVVSLAGYTVSAEKEPLAFVILINGTKNSSWQYRNIEDQIVTALTQYVRGGVSITELINRNLWMTKSIKKPKFAKQTKPQKRFSKMSQASRLRNQKKLH